MNLIRKIFSPIILIISLILLSYTFYKSEIYWNGTKSDFYNIYYIISFLILIFAFLSFFLSNKIKDYLIIVGSSVVISFYTFELYLVFSNKDSKNSNNFEIYKKKTGKEYDKRSKFEIYNDLKLIDSDVKVMVYPTNYFGKNTEIFPYQIHHTQKLYIVMRMAIILFTRVIDMVLIIPMRNGTKKK